MNSKTSLLRIGLGVQALMMLAFVSVGGSAVGQNNWTVPTGETMTIPGATIADYDILWFYADPGMCGCCEVQSEEPSFYMEYLENPQVMHDGGSIDSLTTVSRGTSAPTLYNGMARHCFSVSSSYDTPWVRFDIRISGVPSQGVKLRCDETTLYGGFNTSVTDYNFLEISNTLSPYTSAPLTQEINGTVTAINTVPDPDVVVIDRATFPLPIAAGSRLDINIHSAAGNGAFGTVRLCHDGPLGSINAVVSQYNIVSGPLDFAPVAQEKLLTRAQLRGH